MTSSTPDSSWGKVTLGYSGDSSNQYFNLNVDGRWAVQNMILASPFGAGVSQEVSTYFDLGVSHGRDVLSLSQVFTIGPVPSSVIPSGSPTPAVVDDLDFQIGGIGSIDLGSPGTLDRDFGGASEVVVQDGHIPLSKRRKQRPLTSSSTSRSRSTTVFGPPSRTASSTCKHGTCFPTRMIFRSSG